MYFCIVSKIHEKKMRVKVILPELDNLETGWLFVGVRKTKKDKDYWLPDLGEHMVCMLDGRCENGVVICAIYSDDDVVPVESGDKWAKKFDDGTLIVYDRATHELNVNCVGSINIFGAGPVTVKTPSVKLDAANVNCTGNLIVGGDVSVAGNIDAAGKITDAGGNSNHHKH